MKNLIYKSYPFLPLLLLFLYLSEGIFGLLPFSRIMFPVYLILFFITYKKNTIFSKPIFIYVISILLSILSCYLYHNQSIFNSFNSYVTFIPIIIYFILIRININPDEIERVLFYMFIVFCICYIIQILLYPKAIFIGENTNFDEQLDISLRRIRMSGMSLAGFGFFFSLSKVLINKYRYLPFLILSIVILLLFGFRTLLFFCVLFTLVLNTRINGFSKSFFVGTLLIFIAAWIFSLTEFGQNIFIHMLERQENDQNFGNKDYIRYTTLWYYLYDHFENPLEYFLGSGIPFRGDNNPYAVYYERLESLGIHYYDWGILGMSWMMGVMSLIAMIWYPLKAFFTKLPKEKKYLGVWFGYLLACGFTSAEFVRQGCLLLQGMVLYLIYNYSMYEKNNNRK